jgi:type IV secretory pathway VirB2 component (pilin)
MRTRSKCVSWRFTASRLRELWRLALVALVLAPHALAAQSPWERAASNLETTFTGPLARSLALVSIVIGGLMFMFGEGGAKRQISGIVFGGGLALFAAQFLTWLF